MEGIDAETYGAIFGAAVGIGGFIWGVYTYLRKNPEDRQVTAMHGAAIVSSEVGRDMIQCMSALVKAVVRMADAMEKEAGAMELIRKQLAERDEQAAEDRARSKQEELERKIGDLQRQLNSRRRSP